MDRWRQRLHGKDLTYSPRHSGDARAPRPSASDNLRLQMHRRNPRRLLSGGKRGRTGGDRCAENFRRCFANPVRDDVLLPGAKSPARRSAGRAAVFSIKAASRFRAWPNPFASDSPPPLPDVRQAEIHRRNGLDAPPRLAAEKYARRSGWLQPLVKDAALGSFDIKSRPSILRLWKFPRTQPPPANGLDGPLSRVFEPVQAQLDEVDRRIAAQTAAFDPAIEGYVAYAIGGRGKRLRPLVALLSGGATGASPRAIVDLAVIVELIHIATLVHDDIMDEAERRRAPADGQRALGKFAQRSAGRLPFRACAESLDEFRQHRHQPHDCASRARSLLRRNDPDAAPLRSASRDSRIICESSRMKTGSLFAAPPNWARSSMRRSRRIDSRAEGIRHENRHGLPDLRRLPRHRGERNRNRQNARNRSAQRQTDLAGPDAARIALRAFDRERCCAAHPEGEIEAITAAAAKCARPMAP